MSRQDRTPVSDEQRDEFLESLAEGQSVVDAAGSPSLRRKLYRLKDADPGFAAEWATAYREGTDALTSEARRRAVEGVDEPRMLGHGDNAQLVYIRRYSDTLLMFLIKQRDASYRENYQVQIEGGEKPLIVEHRGVKLTDVLNVAREAGMEPGD